MLSTATIHTAYALILEREPDEEETAFHLSQSKNSEQLLTRLWFSQEHQQWRRVPCPLPPLATQEELSIIFQDIRDAAEYQAQTKPFYVTEDTSWSLRQQFYQTGQLLFEEFSSCLHRNNIDMRFRTLFELGCGSGRMTQRLAPYAQTLLAGDISATQLTYAHQSCHGKNNITFLHMPNPLETMCLLEPFDFFFCIHVFQNNAPPAALILLEAALQRLAPGGLAYFHLPTALVPSTDPDTRSWHAVPQSHIFACLHRQHCLTLDISENGWLGIKRVRSNCFLIRKQT